MVKELNPPRSLLKPNPVSMRGRRDPITRLSRFCEILSLGMVATSFFLPFANELNHPHAPHISLDDFPTLPLKIAVVAVHSRVPWIVLAVLSAVVAVIAYRLRNTLKPRRIFLLAPLAVVLVIGLHAAAQGYLQSQGVLKIELHSAAPAGVENALPNAAGGTLPAATPSVRVESITRLAVREGTMEQWRLLFFGDLLFAAPIFFVWLVRRAIAVSAGKRQ